MERKKLEEVIYNAIREIDMSKKRILKPRKLPPQKLDMIAQKFADSILQERLPPRETKYLLGKIQELVLGPAVEGE